MSTSLSEEFFPIIFDFLLDNNSFLVTFTPEIDIRHQVLCFEGVERRVRPRCIGYVENVIPKYTLDDFTSIFRVSRGMFEELLLLLGPGLRNPHPQGGGRKAVSGR